MSDQPPDPHTASDPSTAPWTGSGEASPPGDASGAPEAPAFGAADDGWRQPPPPSPGAQWGSPPPPPDQWGSPPPPPDQWGQQAPPQDQWGQQPPPQDQWGQQPPPQDQWGQQPPPPQWGQQPPQWGQAPPDQWGQQPAGQWGQQPEKSSSKVVWIVLGVVAVLIIGVIGAAALVLSAARGGVEEFIEEVGQVEFDDGGSADIPDGPRLLEVTGSLGDSESMRFDFTVPDRTEVQIDVIGRSGLDPVLTLFDEDGDEIGRDDDGGDGLDSQLIIDLSGGDYEVEVSGFAGDEGDFEVIVTDR